VRFGYRTSVFKRTPGRWVVARGAFALLDLRPPLRLPALFFFTPYPAS
jgi:hypothetical protein